MSIIETENVHNTASGYGNTSHTPDSDNGQEPNTSESLQYIRTLTAKAKAGQKAMLQETLKAGFPIVYVDRDGRLIKEMPNGETIVL